MPIKYQYLLFISLLHIVLVTLVYFVLQNQKWYFILSETLIILSLILSYKIYTSFIKPIELMKTGVTAIKEEDFNVKFLSTQSTEMNELIEVFNTMLDKLGEEKIRTQEQAYFLENLIAASPIGMIILGFDGEITDINAQARVYLKIRQNEQPDHLDQIEHPLIADLLRLEIGESQIISNDGVQKFRCHISEVIHLGFNRKFVMIEELSKELLASEKEAYGKVIRMMAHEVNNSMGAVNSILQSVIDFGYEGQGDENEYVESLNIAKSRNEELARFMKNFASVIRLPDPSFKECNLVEIVDRASKLMTPLATNSNIEITMVNHLDQLPLHLDESLIQQVLVNIIKNGIESIGQNGQIRITINALAPHLVIADNGPGISESAKEKLFSPFFSTKPTGQGIGLIMIRDILISHNANFTLETNDHSGWTEFSIGFTQN